MLEIFQDADFESMGGVFIERLDYLENDALLKLRIKTGSELPNQVWQATVKDIISEKISRSWVYDNGANNIEIYNDHYLLWEFTDQHTELYVNGAAENISEYIGARFYEMHIANFGDWLPLETYVNGGGLFAAVQMLQGLFARGPKKVLSQYEKWLNQLGKLAYTFESDGLAAHNTRKDSSDLQLMILDDSFFIGKRLIFTRIDD
ncbi:hypothetical protein A8B98_01565 [Hymenobacter sp. UV11]|nr:hypothetical protein A8B98_01565 [Hymenobacter sp. UV11]